MHVDLIGRLHTRRTVSKDMHASGAFGMCRVSSTGGVALQLRRKLPMQCGRFTMNSMACHLPTPLRLSALHLPGNAFGPLTPGLLPRTCRCSLQGELPTYVSRRPSNIQCCCCMAAFTGRRERTCFLACWPSASRGHIKAALVQSPTQSDASAVVMPS